MRLLNSSGSKCLLEYWKNTHIYVLCSSHGRGSPIAITSHCNQLSTTPRGLCHRANGLFRAVLPHSQSTRCLCFIEYNSDEYIGLVHMLHCKLILRVICSIRRASYKINKTTSLLNCMSTTIYWPLPL